MFKSNYFEIIIFLRKYLLIMINNNLFQNVKTWLYTHRIII
jgi:hypothetical protein